MIRINFILFGIFFLALVSCGRKTKEYKNYGPVSVDSLKSIELQDMLLQLEQNPEKVDFTFTAPIEEVCQTAGCWVSVRKEDGELLRVRFKDHFLIPKNTRLGSVAYFHGVAYWDTISVELQKHFAEDAKMNETEIAKINKPKFELSFEADGALVEEIIVPEK